MPEQAPSVPDAPAEAFLRGTGIRRVEFTPEQQEAFDRAFRKREAKLRREFEKMRADLLDTAEVTSQLLNRCKDRISLEDARAIRAGLKAIWFEYQEKKKCQTEH